MQLLALILLVAVTGVLCSEECCRFKAQHECRAYAVVPHPLPGDENDLRNACSKLNEMKLCILDYEKNCDPENEDENTTGRPRTAEEREIRAKWMSRRIEENERVIQVASEICQEESEIHASLVQDIGCYKEIIDLNSENQMCVEYSRSALKELRTRLEEIKKERQEEFSQHSFCLRVLLDMNCFVEQFDNKCSASAKDTALEIIKKAGSLEDLCPTEIRPDIVDLLNSLTSIAKENIYIRELIETVEN